MATFLIVGKNFSGLKNKILERGDNYILLQDQAVTTLFSYTTLFRSDRKSVV